jgi:hypothetical protein
MGTANGIQGENDQVPGFGQIGARKIAVTAEPA